MSVDVASGELAPRLANLLTLALTVAGLPKDYVATNGDTARADRLTQAGSATRVLRVVLASFFFLSSSVCLVPGRLAAAWR